MAYTVSMYDTARQFLFTGGTNWGESMLRASLHTSAGTFSAAHDTWSDVSANEVSETGYLPVDLTNVSATVDTVTRLVTVTCDDIDFGSDRTWTTVEHMIIRDFTNDRLLLHFNLDTPADPVSGTYKWVVDTTYGIARYAENGGYS